jgi:hypothetical protein
MCAWLKDDGVNLLRVEGEFSVALHRFVTVPLEEAAFQKQPLAVDFKKI